MNHLDPMPPWREVLILFVFFVMPTVIVLGTLGWITAAAAFARGRSRGKWFTLGFFFGPLALLFVLVMGVDERGLETRRIKDRELRVCPGCSEVVRFEAQKCRYCLIDLPAVEEIAAPDVSARALRERRQRRAQEGAEHA